MKLLVDVGVGRKVETFLTECGFDSKSVREIDPSMKDTEILKIALSEERVIVSMEKDFGELIFNSGLAHNGVLLLRLEDADGDEKVRVVQKIMEKYASYLAGNFCVYKISSSESKGNSKHKSDFPCGVRISVLT
jgi:predicted nuclease of predicted toxin-antitoxin system